MAQPSDDLELGVSLNAGNAADVLAARIAAISQEAQASLAASAASANPAMAGLEAVYTNPNAPPPLITPGMLASGLVDSAAFVSPSETALDYALAQSRMAEAQSSMAEYAAFGRPAGLPPLLTAPASSYAETYGAAAAQEEARRNYLGADYVDDGFAPGGFVPGTSGYGGGRYGGGGGGNGGGYNGGVSGSDDDGEYGRPNWQAGQAWRKARQQSEYERQYGVGPSEPIDAAFNEDDFIDVPGRGYDSTLKGRFQEGFDKFKGSKIGEWIGSTEGAWALGFGGMQAVGNLNKALDPLVSGEAYLPDQVVEQSATSVLPLVGSIFGALGGAKLGPGGSMTGQFLGQSVGAGLEDIADKYYSGHTAAQERAGEAIGYGQGGKPVVDELVEALKTLSPATKELADTMVLASHAGRVGASAPAEFAQFQYGQGTAFGQNFAGELGFLGSSPFLNPVRNTFVSHPFTGLSATDYLGNAEAAAMQGDYAGERASFAFAETENDRNSQNPAFQRDNDFVKRREGESPWERGAEDLFEPSRVRAYNIARGRLAGGQIDYSKYLGENDLGQRFYGKTAPESEYLPGYEGRKQTILDAEKEIDDDRNAHIASEGSVQFGQALLSRDSSSLSGAMARGGGSQAMNAYLGEMHFDAGGAIHSLNVDAEKDFADALRYTNPAQRNTFLAMAADDQAKVAGIQANLSGVAKSAFDTGLEEQQATFGLFATRDTLRGDSASQLYGGYAEQANYLSRTAASPSSLLSPSARAAMEQSAEEMRYTAGRNVYQEAMGWAGVRDVQGQGQIGIAQTYGSPMDVYRADINQVADEQSQIGIIDNRLRQNIPMSERITLSGQRQQIQNAVSVAPEQARLEAYSAEGSILSSNQAAGRSLLDRNASVYGAAAFTVDIFAADEASVNLAAGGESGSRYGTPAWSEFHRQRADAEAQLVHDRDSSYRYGDQATRVQDMQAEGNFERAMKNPYMDGDPNNSPFTAGRALEGVYQSDLRRAELALRDTPRSSPSYAANAEMVEDYKDKISDLEEQRRRGITEMLPEFIAGSPGQGNLVGILPTPGQSAFFNPNPFIVGTFGKPNIGSDGESHIAQPGGAAGAFLAASGVSGSGVMSGQIGEAILSELKRLNSNVERSNTQGGRSAAVTGSPAGFSQNANLQLNGYKAGGGL